MIIVFPIRYLLLKKVEEDSLDRMEMKKQFVICHLFESEKWYGL